MIASANFHACLYDLWSVEERVCVFGWVWVLFELALLHTVHDPPTLNLQCLLQGTDMSISPCN